ncbi:MAG: DNA mismatch repair protein MutS [Gemmatimonadaceae bacterium]
MTRVISGSAPAATPLMQQYREIKAGHQDAILFFRMGDFYEMFYEDAEVASKALGLTLTSRNSGGAAEVPLAGVPVKAANEYLRRLVQGGFRVAICEQIEDPKNAKGVVKRAVVETITPGAAFADDLLDSALGNFLCAAQITDGTAGLAVADISTGEMHIATAGADDVDAFISRFAPRELLVRKSGAGTVENHPRAQDALVTEREPWEFDSAMAREELQRQFGVASLDGFGIGTSDGLAVGAAGALLRYMRELQPGGLPHLKPPRVERPGATMPLDEMTRRNLELVESLRGGTDQSGTLCSVLDRTLTPMGSRLLRERLLAPLVIRPAIDARLDAVTAFTENPLERARLRGHLDAVRDIERLAAKTAAARATPRELRALGDSLATLPEITGVFPGLAARSHAAPSGILTELIAGWDSCEDLSGEIRRVLVPRPPVSVGDDPTIAGGVDAELDELCALRDGGKDGIARIQAEERARTGISSLKVGFNRVFGYYIEVTNTNAHLVPPDYQRRQTLTGAERFVTPALKEFEERVLSASERIEAREREIFERLRARAAADVRRLQKVARAVAELDVFSALAEVAERESYVRPLITDDYGLAIEAGRHPVVERMMAREKFIPNDVTLDEHARVIIMTGPNMAGKSTILRQVGLIVLMAQIGSYVPARSASIGLVDRLFTRVGASDNLVRGQSTFMVEMAETSAILHSASARSLVLLDEIGRGTSTYDGVSIAWAVTEHLHDRLQCKTIFATHYHELTQLDEQMPAVRNYNVAVRETADRVLFLHRLEPGGADRSYGIEVGRLAGLPAIVLDRAREVLKSLESGHIVSPARRRTAVPAPQLPLFAEESHPVIEQLRGTEPNNLTPLQALDLVARLVDQAKHG